MDGDRNGRTNIDLLRKGSKTGRRHGQAIGILWNIIEPEGAGRIGCRGFFISGYRIPQYNCGGRDYRSGLIYNSARNRSATNRLGEAGVGNRESDPETSGEPGFCTDRHYPQYPDEPIANLRQTHGRAGDLGERDRIRRERTASSPLQKPANGVSLALADRELLSIAERQ